MADATSSSDALADAIGAIPDGAPLREALDTAAALCRDRLGCGLRFTTISGPRWAYFAGERSEFPPARPTSRERLARHVGVVTDLLDMLDEDERRAVLAALKDLVARSKA
jgi:hypothetical protein